MIEIFDISHREGDLRLGRLPLSRGSKRFPLFILLCQRLLEVHTLDSYKTTCSTKSRPPRRVQPSPHQCTGDRRQSPRSPSATKSHNPKETVYPLTSELKETSASSCACWFTGALCQCQGQAKATRQQGKGRPHHRLPRPFQQELTRGYLLGVGCLSQTEGRHRSPAPRWFCAITLSSK